MLSQEQGNFDWVRLMWSAAFDPVKFGWQLYLDRLNILLARVLFNPENDLDPDPETPAPKNGFNRSKYNRSYWGQTPHFTSELTSINCFRLKESTSFDQSLS